MLAAAQAPPTNPPTLLAKGTTSLPFDLHCLRSDQTFADVLLLVGEAKKPVSAHGNILSLRCDYYKQALAIRWSQSVVIPEGVKVDEKGIRAVLSHPDIDEETMDVLLEFIYTGEADVPDTLLTSVAIAADQLLLESIKIQCLEHRVKHSLVPENALELYSLCDKLH
ncbi:hypothetical protein HDU98_010378 [Podochytrium sp. JEL0797]|nr:hypothetical protein HDU98_010378 [Podochytrium sp. JEL0797]